MTNLLRKYAKRKAGWRVRFLLTDDGKVVENKVVLTNGLGVDYVVEPDSSLEGDKMLHSLENRVTQKLKELEEKDLMYVSREALMFAVYARVLRSQAQCFVGLLTHDKKYDLNLFINHTDKMVKSLDENYRGMLSPDIYERFTDDMEDIVFDVFNVLKKSFEKGDVLALREYINRFHEPVIAKKDDSDNKIPSKK